MNKKKNGENTEENGEIKPVLAGFSKNGLKDREEMRARLQNKLLEFEKKRNGKRKYDEIAGEDERETKKRKRTEKKDNRKSQKSQKPPKTGNNGNKSTEENNNNGIKSTEEGNGNNEDDTDEYFEYGSFKYVSGMPVPSYLANNKKYPNKKILLQKTLDNQKKLEELKDTEEGQQLKENIAWDNMLKRAQGEKVKDDPKKLKQSIKREDWKKKKSKKLWDERLGQQKKRQNEAQKKRQTNIQKKIQRKKGGTKSRPGFEGKKTFLNN
jgi:hypothetical protein